MIKNDLTKTLSFLFLIVLFFIIVLYFAESNEVVNRLSAIFSAISLVLAVFISIYSEYKANRSVRLNSLNIYYTELLRSYNDLTILLESNIVLQGSIALKAASGVMRSSDYLYKNPDNFLFQESLITLTRVNDLLENVITNFQDEDDYISLSTNIFLSANEIVTNFKLLIETMKKNEAKLSDKQGAVLKGYSLIVFEISKKITMLQSLILEHRNIPFYKIEEIHLTNNIDE